jgi:hypothetical protein
VRTDPWTLNRLLDDPNQIGAATSEGRLVIEGDDTVINRLIAARRPGS